MVFLSRWWFQTFSIFTPIFQDSHFDEHIFQMGGKNHQPEKILGHGIFRIRWWQLKYFWNFYPETWGNDPIWLIFFKWVETTNQLWSFTSRVDIFLTRGPHRGPETKTWHVSWQFSVPVDVQFGFERLGGIDIPRYLLIMGSHWCIFPQKNDFNNVKTPISRCIPCKYYYQLCIPPPAMLIYWRVQGCPRKLVTIYS